MREIENPYQSPNHSSSLVRASRYRRTSRLKFLYVIALILILSFAVTLIVAPRQALSISNSFLFFGLNVAGPFIALIPLFYGMGPHSALIMVVAVLVFFATVCYLIRPNNVSLVISLTSAVTWVSVAPVLIIILPELGIRA